MNFLNENLVLYFAGRPQVIIGLFLETLFYFKYFELQILLAHVARPPIPVLSHMNHRDPKSAYVGRR